MDKGLPQDWKKRIEGKRVILYITSLSNMLNNTMGHIEKIEYVIDTFRNLQENIILWWRPHPLEISTLESMHPELVKKYLQVRKQYEQEKWGILDISADLHRAIVISDAYYGDYSSIIELYRKTGKPLLISSDNIQETEELVDIDYWISDLYINDNKMYFISNCFNYLFIMNMYTFRVENIIELLTIRPFELNSFLRMLYINEEIFIIPKDGRGIYIYDTIKEKITFYLCKIDTDSKHSFVYKGSNNELKLLSLNKRITGKVFTNQKTWNIGTSVFGSGVNLSQIYEENEKFVYCNKKENNLIYKIDKDADSYEIIMIGDKNDKFWGIKKIDDILVIPHVNIPKITLWNEKTRERVCLKNFPKSFTSDLVRPYIDLIKHENMLYLFPKFSNMILKIDIQKKKIEEYALNLKNDYNNIREMYSCVKLINKKIYAFANYKNVWQIFDLEKDIVEERRMLFTKEQQQNILNRSIIGNASKEYSYTDGFFGSESNSYYTLSKYIDSLILNYDKVAREKYENIGQEIHKNLISG